MATARKEIVDPKVTRLYHCISKCVRGGYLLGDDPSQIHNQALGDGLENRKQWIEDRLEFLTQHFAVSVAGFAILDNHLHVLVRLDPQVALDWTDEQVVRNWLAIYPPSSLDMNNEQLVQQALNKELASPPRVIQLRERLSSLSWFMKALKEPISRMANQIDGCSGAFWQSRFKSIAILDEEALLATCVYIDLNPVAAGIALTPEESLHTSVRQRVEHAREQGKIEVLKLARQGSVAASQGAGNLEQDHWLIPIEDRRQHTNAAEPSKREGLLPTFSLGSYLQLVEYTGRLFREGKARLSDGLQEVFDRLESSADIWQARMKRLMGSVGMRGSFFATDPQTLRTKAQQTGKRRANLQLYSVNPIPASG
jgi:REP element-mobilizing transposase RayT